MCARSARWVMGTIRDELSGALPAREQRAQARTALLNQLMLSAMVLVVVVLSALIGENTGRELFLAGTLLIFSGAAATLMVPWSRIARFWSVGVPLADIVAIAMLRAAEPDSGLGLLWAFPAMWLAALGLITFIVQLVVIATIYWATIVEQPGPGWTYATLLLPVVLLAISAASFVSTRRFVAQRILLDKQAVLLTNALSRAQRQEELQTEILDAVDFGVIRIAPDGRITVVNEALGRFQRRIPGFGNLDQSLADPYRADGTTPLPPEERPLLRALRGEVFDNQIVWFGAVDQRRWALSMTVRRLHDAHGADAGCVLIARDVTAETTALRARDRLVASVSHELRTPLTSVLGYIDLAMDHLDQPAQAEKDLQVASSNGERLLEIVADILAASSSSRLSMDMTISPEELDMAKLMLGAAQAWRPRAAERAIGISLSGVEPARAYVDPLRIRQVVDNLISNAVKYNRDGGEVSLGTTSDGVSTWMMVRDTGLGISEADQARLFERFFRARTGVDGTGLGLSISRDIVRAHGGDLIVHSTPGVGSTFIVQVPASADAALAADAPTVDPADRGEA